MPVVDLSDHPIVKTAYGRWQPLNGPLGVAGFGISAIVCDPGEEFDIEHDETDSGQQEVYVVVAGRATFTIGWSVRSTTGMGAPVLECESYSYPAQSKRVSSGTASAASWS